jgi:hypothetical protein
MRRTFLKSSITSVAAFTLANMLAGPLAAANEDAKNYQKALALLRASLQGTLLLPADPGYLKCAYSANTRFNSVLPLAIALCESAAMCPSASDGLKK